MSADHHDRHLQLAHDLAQGLDAIHARHLKIQSDGIRLEFFDFLERESAIHRGAHNVNGIVTLEQLRNEFAHERRVIHHQDANHLWVCSHGAPSLVWIQ